MSDSQEQAALSNEELPQMALDPVFANAKKLKKYYRLCDTKVEGR
jgi:hypothetical protein